MDGLWGRLGRGGPAFLRKRSQPVSSRLIGREGQRRADRRRLMAWRPDTSASKVLTRMHGGDQVLTVILALC